MAVRSSQREGTHMSTPEAARKRMEIGVAAAFVVVGAVIFFAWSWLGMFVVLIGLIALGGIKLGKW
jgi:hypothetical protein